METGTPDAAGVVSTPRPPDERGPRHRRRRLWPWITGVLILVAVIGAVASLYASRDRGAPVASERPAGNAPSPIPEPLVAPAPVDLKAKVTPYRVVLSWSAPSDPAEIERYEVLRDGRSVGRATAPSTRFADNGLVPGRDYSYEVVAHVEDQLPSDAVSVEVSTPLPPLAEARLEGTFNVTTRFTSRSGYGDYSAPNLGWTFKPKCRQRACNVAWQDANNKSIKAILERTKSTYRGSFGGRFLIQCGQTPMISSITLDLRVAKARVIDDEWRATRLTGTLTQSEAAQLGCRSSSATLAVNAKLYD